MAQEEAGLHAVAFVERSGGLREQLGRWHPGAQFRDGDGGVRVRRLAAYFDGDLGALAELPVLTDGTPFQRRVWDELRRIPVGQTISYAELARRIGKPKAMRAVGAANGKNPVAIVVPCHRVVAANGTLWGYGGGLPRKAWLLKHEGALLA
ncbi:MAG TPA: methylated-DNA--[protein]-cysteine S-methyltransferase [Myxococcales bacterium]|nr:methylated-DNA--[protein]-cysteine S-methyltransferase [Myxococcales bacterium]